LDCSGSGDLLLDWEFHEIERVLKDNNFLDLESRSGPPGGITSSITARYDDISHTVEMRNATTQPYRNIEEKIRKIVLPKVKETEMVR